MRIISGRAKGTSLYTLKGNNTRPTSDRAKEALFNIVGADIIDCNFLDLFSGSGAIGLEAASRGAKKVILVDNSRDATDIIKRNVEKTHLEDKTQIYNMDFNKVLKTKIKEKQDYIFLDPPYESNLLYESISVILENNILEKDGTIIAETDKVEEIKKQVEKLSVNIIDIRKYGRNQFLFLRVV